MASQNLRLLFLGFILIALCIHNCSARKALIEDLKKPEKFQPKPAIMPESSHGRGKNNETMISKQEDEIDLQSCGGGCVPECFELPCPVIEGEVWVPTPPTYTPLPPHYEHTPAIPVLTPQPDHLVPTPPLVTRHGPHLERIYVVPSPPPPPCPMPCEPWYGPGPCPCTCEEDADVKEGIKTESESDNKAQKKGEIRDSPVLSSGQKTQKDADAPMPAVMDGSNAHV